MHFERYWISGDEEYILLATNRQKVLRMKSHKRLMIELATLILCQLLYLSYLFQGDYASDRGQPRDTRRLCDLVADTS
jgi:hypothetical protein